MRTATYLLKIDDQIRRDLLDALEPLESNSARHWALSEIIVQLTPLADQPEPIDCASLIDRIISENRAGAMRDFISERSAS
jgi:hypothetical protein